MLRHRSDGLAETRQRDSEEKRPDEREGQELRPDDIQASSAKDNLLRDLHEVSGRRCDHDLLDEFGHALARGYTAG